MCSCDHAAGQGSPPSTVGLTKSALGAYFKGPLLRSGRRKPSRFYLFPDAKAYEAYCQNAGRSLQQPFGFYRPDERRIVMNAGPGIARSRTSWFTRSSKRDFPQGAHLAERRHRLLFRSAHVPAPGQIPASRMRTCLLRALGSARSATRRAAGPCSRERQIHSA